MLNSRMTFTTVAIATLVSGCGTSDAPADGSGAAPSAGRASAGASTVGGAAPSGGVAGAESGGATMTSVSGGGGGGGRVGFGGSATGGVGGSGVSEAGSGASGASAIGTCSPPTDVFSPIEDLSKTGCVDPGDPRKPIARAIGYEVNSPLWSDSADKLRAFVLPAGTTIHVRNCAANPGDCPGGNADDGRWDFPVGAVMIKIFMFDSKLVETRLFMHLDADDWVGYSYEWDEAQTGAKIVSSDRVAVTFNTGTRSVPWHYPSQDDCMNCHNRAAGSTLGTETAQMNRVVGGVNQIDKFSALGLFETAPSKPYKLALVTPYTSQVGSPPPGATTEEEARSYLHANCGFCHRPDGNFANFDLRYDTSLKDMNVCNVEVKKGALATAPTETKIMVPGLHKSSVLWLRMNQSDPDSGRMPQIASYAVDSNAVKVVGDWIDSLTACP